MSWWAPSRLGIGLRSPPSRWVSEWTWWIRCGRLGVCKRAWKIATCLGCLGIWKWNSLSFEVIALSAGVAAARFGLCAAESRNGTVGIIKGNWGIPRRRRSWRELRGLLPILMQEVQRLPSYESNYYDREKELHNDLTKLRQKQDMLRRESGFFVFTRRKNMGTRGVSIAIGWGGASINT